MNHPEDRTAAEEPLDIADSRRSSARQSTDDLIAHDQAVCGQAAGDGATRGDLKILSRALRELRYAFKVFTPYRDRRKVTIFGSARTPPEATRLSAGGRVRPGDGRARLAGRDRRRQRDHGGRARGRGPRALDGPEHPAALRAGGQPGHRRRSQAGPHEVLLHAQADVRQGVRRHLPAAGRVRHAGRRPGSAHAAADRQARHGAGRASRRAGRRLLAALPSVHPAAPAGRRDDRRRRTCRCTS